MVKIKFTETAYENMLIHMLQFGNKSLKKTNEVMGLIYGARSGDTLTIKKIIPIKHGPDCEKAFTEPDYVTFSEVDAKILKEESLESFGFYTSHPKMGFYLSQNEIKNLVYFMHEKKNAYAVAVIGDHAQMDQPDNYGFKVYQLKDASHGMSSDFFEIAIEIEPPAEMNIYKKTKFLIEQAQKRQPYIEEQGVQLKADDNLWDSGFGDTETPEQKAMKKVQPILDVLKSEVPNVGESFLVAALNAYNEFIDNIAQFIGKPFNDTSSDLIALRESYDYGMGNVQAWFAATFKKHAEKAIEEYQRTYTTTNEGQAESLKAIKAVLINQLKEYEKILKTFS
jgi:hypothetical protein